CEMSRTRRLSPCRLVPAKWNVLWTTDVCLLNEIPNHSVTFPVNGDTFGSGSLTLVTLPSLSTVPCRYAVTVMVPVNVVVNHASWALFTVMCSMPLPVPTNVAKSVDTHSGHPAPGGAGAFSSSTSLKCAVSVHGAGCANPHAKSGAVA